MIKKKVCLLILDGLGEGEKNISNPLRFAKTPNLDYLRKNYPFCLLNASGISVGLPSNEPGNCEVGHLTIGTGTIYYQNRTKINLDIENGEFYKNEQLLKIINHCQKYNSRLHLIGLLSESVSITDINHIYALFNLAKTHNLQNIYLHLFTDGIESKPKSALNLINKILTVIKNQNYPFKIATLCGRFYALDTSRNYILRTQKAFLLIVEGKGNQISDPLQYLKEKYKDPNFNDSLLEPLVLDENGIIKDNDAVLFFHFENKDILQLAEAFLNPDFKEFQRPPRKNLYLASLTRYLDLDYPVIFEEQKILNNLSRIIAENKLSQIKIIDYDRKDLLKYYFNGFIKEEHPNEVYKILSSFTIEKEQLLNQTKEFFNFLILILNEKTFDFIVANLPTLDLIAHHNSFKEAIFFIEKIDEFIGIIYQEILKTDYILIITSDHGNIEKMVNPNSGQKDTAHNSNPVPFYLIDTTRKQAKNDDTINFYNNKIIGSLVDIAPTILEIFNIPKPKEFNGKSLLKFL